MCNVGFTLNRPKKIEPALFSTKRHIHCQDSYVGFIHSWERQMQHEAPSFPPSSLDLQDHSQTYRDSSSFFMQILETGPHQHCTLTYHKLLSKHGKVQFLCFCKKSNTFNTFVGKKLQTELLRLRHVGSTCKFSQFFYNHFTKSPFPRNPGITKTRSHSMERSNNAIQTHFEYISYASSVLLPREKKAHVG